MLTRLQRIGSSVRRQLVWPARRLALPFLSASMNLPASRPDYGKRSDDPDCGGCNSAGSTDDPCRCAGYWGMISRGERTIQLALCSRVYHSSHVRSVGVLLWYHANFSYQDLTDGPKGYSAADFERSRQMHCNRSWKGLVKNTGTLLSRARPRFLHVKLIKGGLHAKIISLHYSTHYVRYIVAPVHDGDHSARLSSITSVCAHLQSRRHRSPRLHLDCRRWLL